MNKDVINENCNIVIKNENSEIKIILNLDNISWKFLNNTFQYVEYEKRKMIHVSLLKYTKNFKTTLNYQRVN